MHRSLQVRRSAERLRDHGENVHRRRVDASHQRARSIEDRQRIAREILLNGVNGRVHLLRVHRTSRWIGL